MKQERFDLSLGIAVVVMVVAAGAFVGYMAAVSAQERVQSWTFKACYTNGCIKEVLDKLPPDNARDAKLTTWENKTYVWYREGMR